MDDLCGGRVDRGEEGRVRVLRGAIEFIAVWPL